MNDFLFRYLERFLFHFSVENDEKKIIHVDFFFFFFCMWIGLLTFVSFSHVQIKFVGM